MRRWRISIVAVLKSCGPPRRRAGAIWQNLTFCEKGICRCPFEHMYDEMMLGVLADKNRKADGAPSNVELMAR